MDDERVRLDVDGPMGLNLSTEQEINEAMSADIGCVGYRCVAGGDAVLWAVPDHEVLIKGRGCIPLALNFGWICARNRPRCPARRSGPGVGHESHSRKVPEKFVDTFC